MRLRAVQVSDWETFHENRHDSESQRRGWRIPFPRSPEAARRWAEDLALRDPATDSFFFAIENLEGALVGSINSHDCDARQGTFSIGIGVFRQYWRKGYAGDAIQIMLRYFFQELGYQKANATVYEFNEPSIKLFEGLGFQREGRRRRMIFTNGRHYDELLFGMTREEFLQS